MPSCALIIGSDYQWEEEELLQEAKAAGYDAEFIAAGDLFLTVDEHEADILLKGTSMRSRFKESRIIFRRARGAERTMATVALLAEHWKVPATDSAVSILSNVNKSMSIPTISLKEIRHIPSAFLSVDTSATEAVASLPLPLLAKPALGRHGEGVEIFHTQEEMKAYLAKRQEDIILQRYLPLESEYRVFIVGDKALGVIRKIPAEGSKVANYAAGARFEADELPARVVEETIDICRQQKIDIGGVDIAYANDTYYLLEVNRCPEFQAFQKATGVNVAHAIVAWFLHP